MKEGVYKRKDGRYELRYCDSINIKGEKHYKSLYGKSESEVIEKRNLMISLQQKSYKKNDKLLFSFFIDRWLEKCKIHCKKSTYSTYLYVVLSRIKPFFGSMRIEDIDLCKINSYTNFLLESGLHSNTVKHILIIFQQILKFSDIKINIIFPKIPIQKITVLQKNDQKILESYLLKHLDHIAVGIYLALYTGLRIGELCALQWKNIDLKNQKLYVSKNLIRVKNFSVSNKKKTIVILDDPKSISSKREIPLSKFILSLLKKIYINNDDYFLLTGTNTYIEPRTFLLKYKKILKASHLENYKFHALRHTFATRCIEIGCDPKTLSEILGHSNVKITLDRYVHPNYNNKVVLINKLNPYVSIS